jgi:8-oxo-dGTP pyrophosphatase MutT (NUDIX family)
MKRLLKFAGLIGFWLSWPAMFIYLKIGARTRVVVVIDDKILMVKTWLGTGKWQLPGGGLHKGEAPKSGAVREVFEETGVLLQERELVPIGDGLVASSQTRHGLTFRYYAFYARALQLPDVRPQLAEISDVGFIPMAKITEQTTSKDALAIVRAWQTQV